MSKRQKTKAGSDPIRTLRERLGTILACAAVGAIAALLVSLTAQQDRPAASAEVRMTPPLPTTLNPGPEFASGTVATLADELEAGAAAPAFERRIAAAVGGIEPSQVGGDVTLSNPVGTSKVMIVTRGDDDDQALRIGRAAVAGVAAAIDSEASRQTAPMLRAAETAPGADSGGAEGAEVLGLIAKIRSDSAAMAHVARVTATPKLTGAGSKRKIALNVVAGFVLGALVGAAVAFLAGRDRRKTA